MPIKQTIGDTYTAVAGAVLPIHLNVRAEVLPGRGVHVSFSESGTGQEVFNSVLEAEGIEALTLAFSDFQSSTKEGGR